MENNNEEEVNIIPVIPLSIDDIDFEAIDCIPSGPDINLVEDLELDRGNITITTTSTTTILLL